MARVCYAIESNRIALHIRLKSGADEFTITLVGVALSMSEMQLPAHE